MKKILFLLILSTSIHAATLSEKLFLNDKSGFDVSDEQIASLENSVNDLVDINSNVVENSFTDGGKTNAKWKATGYVTSIGVTSTGKLGILGFKGSAMAEIFWRKKKVANAFLSDFKDQERTDAVLSDLSEVGINDGLEHLMAIVKGSKKVDNLDNARVGLKQKLIEFANLVKDTQADQSKAWYLSGIRLDLSISASGVFTPVYTVGGTLNLRVVWVPVRAKNIPPASTGVNVNSLSLMVDDLTNVLGEISDSKKLEAKGLALNTVRFGLGASAAGKVFFGKASGSLVFSVIMAKNPKYKGQQNLTVIEMKNNTLPIGVDDNSEVKTMDWKIFKKGIAKSLKLSRSFIKKNIDQDKENKHKWEVYLIRTSYSMSPSKGIGLVTVGGIAEIQMLYTK